MVRLTRLSLPGYTQHIIQRGNNRQATFFAEADYRYYLDVLKEAADKYQCDIHAYVLMTNHVHLLATPRTEQGLSKCMQLLGRRYVRRINHIYKRSGTLWEGRYKSALVDTERYLLTCYRYIELNPVRANMVSHPRDYPWSSFHYHALGEPDPVITDHPDYLRLGKSAPARRRAYQALFETDLDEETLATLRDTVQRGWALGGDRFKKEIERITQRRIEPLPRGGKRRGAGRPKQKDEDE